MDDTLDAKRTEASRLGDHGVPDSNDATTCKRGLAHDLKAGPTSLIQELGQSASVGQVRVGGVDDAVTASSARFPVPMSHLDLHDTSHITTPGIGKWHIVHLVLEVLQPHLLPDS